MNPRRDLAVFMNARRIAQDDARLLIRYRGRHRRIRRLRLGHGHRTTNVDHGFPTLQRRDVRTCQDICLAIRDECRDLRPIVELIGLAFGRPAKADDAWHITIDAPSSTLRAALRRAVRIDGQRRPIPVHAEFLRRILLQCDDTRLQRYLLGRHIERMQHSLSAYLLLFCSIEKQGICRTVNQKPLSRSVKPLLAYIFLPIFLILVYRENSCFSQR